MRLIDVKTLELTEANESEVLKYAILSHTWGKEEVTYDDMVNGTAKQKKGYAKIQGACAVAKKNGFRYVWIDTCCINKQSSAELSEAINSMFRWYNHSSVCYAYLEDVSYIPSPSVLSLGAAETENPALFKALSRSRWFTRGWTLQELIAPVNLVFHSKAWSEVGSRSSLLDIVSRITGVDEDVLDSGMHRGMRNMSHKLLRERKETAISRKSVATRMSWFANRETTRPEDIAYSLLGIFGVHMPLLYGEGGVNAFYRLQEAIIRNSDDHSILAWNPSGRPGVEYRIGVFAHHPSQFKNIACICRLPSSGHLFSVTDRGLQVRLQLVERTKDDVWGVQDSDAFWGILRCYEEDNFYGPLAIPLLRMQTGADIFFRDSEDSLTTLCYDQITEDNPIDTPQCDSTEIVRLGERLAHKAPKSDRHGVGWKTIFIPKVYSFTEFTPLRVEYFQLKNVPTEFKAVPVFPNSGWNQRTQTMRLAPLNDHGYLTFRVSSRNLVSPNGFVAFFGLQRSSSTTDDVSVSPWICLEPLENYIPIELSIRSQNYWESRKAFGSESFLHVFNGSSTVVLKVTIKRETRMGMNVSFITFSWEREEDTVK